MIFYYLANTSKFNDFTVGRRNRTYFLYQINFKEQKYINLIIEYSKIYNIKELYNKIGVEFDDIINSKGVYMVNGIEISPCALSTSERGMLFAMLCKYLNKEVFIVG